MRVNIDATCLLHICTRSYHRKLIAQFASSRHFQSLFTQDNTWNGVVRDDEADHGDVDEGGGGDEEALHVGAGLPPQDDVDPGHRGVGVVPVDAELHHAAAGREGLEAHGVLQVGWREVE